MPQKITSAKTSRKQIPAVAKMLTASQWAYLGSTVLDFGGGRFDEFTKFMAAFQVRSFVYDPYNRTPEHNEFVRRTLDSVAADAAFVSNVLNVIREPAARLEALQQVKKWVKMGGRVYITVYEGDGSGRGEVTRDGWQANRPLRNYLREIRKVFPEAQLVNQGRMILVNFRMM